MKAEPRGSRTAEQLMAAEAQRIEAALPRGARRVALDERGERVTTAQLAERLLAWQRDGRDAALLIGGPDGLDPALKASCDETLRLSDLTLPHAFARVLVAEALYRAWSVTPAIRTTANDRRRRAASLADVAVHDGPATRLRLPRLAEPAPARAARADRRRHEPLLPGRRRRRGARGRRAGRATGALRGAGDTRQARRGAAPARRAGLPAAPVLCADTTVALGRRILAKPADAADAARMLGLLAGRTHRVITAVAVATAKRTARCSRAVLARALRAARRGADRHATSPAASRSARPAPTRSRARPRPGSRRIEGSYTGIMGLPLYETASCCARAGVAGGA